MTKLVMVIPSLKTGGAERIFSFIANNLDGHKFQLYLILFDSEKIQFAINKEKIAFIDLKKKGIIKGASALIKQLRQIKPDVIFSTVTHLNILMGIIRVFLYKAKIVVREVSVISINNKEQPLPSVFNFLIRVFYRKLDVIICQSKDMADDLIKNFNIPEKRIIVVNNPITSAVKPVLHEKNVTLRFLSVGRLIPLKGFERLIDIVSKFDFDFKYFIAGDGIEYASLKNKVESIGLQDKIIFLGKVDVLEPLYEATDFYLHGSYYEGFPNALLEAASYGVPIISFNTPGGINEIIIEGFNGLIANNEEQYYTAALNAIARDWDRDLIQKDIYNRFGKDKILLAYENVLAVN